MNKTEKVLIGLIIFIVGVGLYMLHIKDSETDRILAKAEISLAEARKWVASQEMELNELNDELEYYVVQETEHIMPSKYPYSHAFLSAYYLYGEGDVFVWNDKQYLIKFREDNTITLEDYHLVKENNNDTQWVLNGNDLDDNCRTNIHDECGVCDGPGIYTWYADNDLDGLGDPNNIVQSCETP